MYRTNSINYFKYVSSKAGGSYILRKFLCIADTINTTLVWLYGPTVWISKHILQCVHQIISLHITVCPQDNQYTHITVCLPDNQPS